MFANILILYLFISCLSNVLLLMKYNIPESYLPSTINTCIQIIDNREDNRLNKNQQKEKNERITSIYRNLAT